MIDTDNDLRPWVPEGARPFQVGDQVRVRLSGECDLVFRSERLQSGKLIARSTHRAETDGKDGLIVRIDDLHSHSYQVRYHEDIETELGFLRQSWYAPSELELIEEAAR